MSDTRGYNYKYDTAAAQLGTGFGVTGAYPLDARYSVASLDDFKNSSSVTMYKGMLFFDDSTGKLYKITSVGFPKGENCTWEEVGADTDTKNTAGATNDSEKLFLVGAKILGTNPQTYSHLDVYETDGKLHACQLEIGTGTAKALYSVAEGIYSVASGNCSHAEGRSSIALGEASHAEGYGTSTALGGTFSFILTADSTEILCSYPAFVKEGWVLELKKDNNLIYRKVKALGSLSITIDAAPGFSGTPDLISTVTNVAYGSYTHVEGYSTLAFCEASHAEGALTSASNIRSHAEGAITRASGPYTHSEGISTAASGFGAHAEGINTNSTSEGSHTEGTNIPLTDLGEIASVSSGGTITFVNTRPSNLVENEVLFISTSPYNFNNIYRTVFNENVSGTLISCKEYNITADLSGYHVYSTKKTTASGVGSHAENGGTTAQGHYSHAEGYNTVTNNEAEHAQGRYNVSHESSTDASATIHSIGIGTSSTSSNAIEVMKNGDVYVKNIGNYDGVHIKGETNAPAGLQTLQEAVLQKSGGVMTGLVYHQTNTLTPSSNVITVTADKRYNWTSTASNVTLKIQQPTRTVDNVTSAYLDGPCEVICAIKNTNSSDITLTLPYNTNAYMVDSSGNLINTSGSEAFTHNMTGEQTFTIGQNKIAEMVITYWSTTDASFNGGVEEY